MPFLTLFQLSRGGQCTLARSTTMALNSNTNDMTLAVKMALNSISNIYDLSFKMELTHSHTMTPFDAPGKQAF